MPEFFGLCGRFTPTPCKLAWSSTYPNKVGIYPNEFLPSRRTIYHASSDAGFNFTLPIVSAGETFGLAGGGLIGGFGQFGPPQSDIFRPQSHIATIFARTANRLNIAHIVTQAEFQSAQSNEGIVTINVGEYIFEFLGVTDQKEVFETQLTEEELEEINGTGEAESDRAFRKLFINEVPSARDRFINIELNKRGVEYRFDNGGPKVNSALNLAGIGDLKNASYRDGSSRKITVDFNKITERIIPPEGTADPPPGSLQADAREVRAGDIIYFSYVAVKDHYMRQNIEAGYTIQAVSIPPQAFGFPSKLLVANYRFYEWNIDSEDPTQLPERVGSWRIVESFNVATNVVGVVGSPGDGNLGQFPITKGGGVVPVNVLDTRNITVEELDTYIANRPGSPRQANYSLNLNQTVFNGSYHQQLDDAYKLSPWFLRRGYSTNSDYSDVVAHVFYNVHPDAMLKRDVDKWGIEKTLAQEIEIDIKQGKDTFFPFMDDVEVINPTEGVSKFLNSGNTRFEPIQPVSRYTVSNLEIEAGVAGSIQLGNTGSTDDIVVVFNYNSNIITERFAEDTRVLSERHFTLNQRGPRTIAIEGLVGRIGAVTCLADPSKAFSFVAHVNDQNFMLFNKFTSAIIHNGLSTMTYRPDLNTPPQLDNENPQPNEFTSQLGFSGLLGDKPGITPGSISSYSNFANISSFLYKTTNRQKLLSLLPSLEEDQIEEITIEHTDDRIIIPVGSGYVGRTELEYFCTQPGGVVALFQFKTGGLEGVVDSIHFAETKTDQPLRMRIPHYWISGSTIEIVGENINTVRIHAATILQVASTKSVDFLDSGESSSADEKLGFINGNFPTRSLFFETDVMSLGEDEKSRLFIFFNDADGGISCIMSIDYGQTWMFHYGIVEPIDQEEVRNPFVVHAFESRGCFLFFQFLGKIMCKFIPFELFRQEDAMLVQKFDTDVLQEDDNGNKSELGSIYSIAGQTLRRGTVAFPAAGNLFDEVFRKLSGRNSDNGNALEDLETREIEDSQGNVVSRITRKNPISIAPGSAFTRDDIEDIHFSVYRTDKGILKLFFLAPVRAEIGGGNQLQSHFSIDNGKTWYDYWEWIEYGYNRLRIDPAEKTQFIDRSAGRDVPDSIEAADPRESDELYSFGINVHWSRLARQKVGDLSLDAESQVLDIESPYVFYQKSTKKVFLFYIYESCLLCKIFNEEVFLEAAKRNREGRSGGGMSQVKTLLERVTKNHFVDGDLSVSELREEIHRYLNVESNEIMLQGNIVFNSQWGIDVFNEDRRISSQRVCAYALPQGGVRVLYKHSKSKNLRAAIWTGSAWIVEDLLKPADLPPPVIEPRSSTGLTGVCGGFSGTGFPCGDIGTSQGSGDSGGDTGGTGGSAAGGG